MIQYWLKLCKYLKDIVLILLSMSTKPIQQTQN